MAKKQVIEDIVEEVKRNPERYKGFLEAILSYGRRLVGRRYGIKEPQVIAALNVVAILMDVLLDDEQEKEFLARLEKEFGD